MHKAWTVIKDLYWNKEVLFIYVVIALVLAILTATGAIRWTWGIPGDESHTPARPGIEEVETA